MKALFWKGGGEENGDVPWQRPEDTATDDGETVEFETGDVVNVDLDIDVLTFNNMPSHVTLYTEERHWYFVLSIDEARKIQSILNEYDHDYVTAALEEARAQIAMKNSS